MQDIHQQNLQAMIRERERTRRLKMDDRISKQAEEYKFLPFRDWDDETLRRWIVQ